MIEPLESRIAPASFGYLDVDGDLVTIVTSKGTNQDLANIVAPFLSNEGVAGGKELQRIDFSQNPIVFERTDLSVTARRGPLGGDGLVNVGYLDATGTDGGGNLDLGNLKISGDLGRIVAGDSTTSTAGVKSLTVGTMGRYGTDTQSGGGPSQDSFIMGAVGKLSVRGDVAGGSFLVSGGATAADGRIGSLAIGGSLIGGDAGFTGFISATGDIATVKVAHNIEGSGNGAGQISSGGKIGSATIGGSIVGGGGFHSGRLQAASFGTVLLKGNLVGADRAGVMTMNTAGAIESTGSAGSISIGGSLLGGNDPGSASIIVGGNLASLSIGGSVVGRGADTAGISVGGTLGNLTLRGSVLGGISQFSARIEAGSFGKIAIGGDVRGGADAQFSGQLTCIGTVGSLSIGGSLIGGSDTDLSDGGTTGRFSGSIDFQQTGSISIRGSVLGGSGDNSGVISAKLNGVGKLSIGGSLIGGQGNRSGAIIATDVLGPVSIGGDVRGADALGFDVVTSGAIVAQGITSITIGGSLVAGRQVTANTLTQSGFIGAVDAIGSVVVKGSLIGNSVNPVGIVARGQAVPTGTLDVAIGKITVGGRVENGLILAGYSLSYRGLNSDAQIGSVSVGGDWIASSLLAGIDPAGDGKTGTGDDHELTGGVNYGSGPTKDTLGVTSKIAGIVIKGGVFGTPGIGTDSFGFAAQEIGFFKVAGTTVPLKPGVANDVFASSSAPPLGAGRSTATPDSFEVHVLEV